MNARRTRLAPRRSRVPTGSLVTRILLPLLLLLPWSPGAACAVVAANENEAVVLKDFAALGAGDVEGLAAVFAPQFAMHRLPTEPHALAGPRSDTLRTREQLRAHFRREFVAEPPAQHEVLEMVSLGDLVAVRVAVHLPDRASPDHAFTVFRVSDGLIHAIWHVAHERDAGPGSGADARATIQRLVAAHNRADADAFVDLYHPDARHSHARDDRARLGGGPARRTTDHAGRRRFYRDLYAKGAPVQVVIAASAALGEWVATRERYADPEGARDHLTLYRVRDGLIIDDWHLAP